MVRHKPKSYQQPKIKEQSSTLKEIKIMIELSKNTEGKQNQKTKTSSKLYTVEIKDDSQI